jgi:hypothetical protein
MEHAFIVCLLSSFVHGLSNAIGVVDQNHVAKSLKSQLALGTRVTTAGNCLFDMGLCTLTSVHNDIYRV